MANNCGISGGLTFDCTKKQKASGGNKQKFWIGNIEDINRTYGDGGLTIDYNGYVQNIAFEQYKGLYAFTGTKLGNQNTDDASRNDGGIANFPVTIIFKAYDVTPADSLIIEQLANADGLFVIMQTSSGAFKIYGFELGLTLASAPRSSGSQPADDSSRTVTLQGNEPKLPYYFFNTSEAHSLSLIEAYEV